MAHSLLTSGIRNWLQETFASMPFNLCIDCWGADQICIQAVPSDSIPLLTLQIKHPGVIRKLLLLQDPLVLAEAYLDGFVDFVGQIEDVIKLAESISRQNQGYKAFLAWLESLSLPSLPKASREISRDKQILHARTRDLDQAAIQYHYDVGNDFYRLWLDPMLVYSCAHFENADMSLAKAQTAKLNLICRKLQLKPGEYLLDIGCGWGALLHWAQAHYGVKGYGITLSQEQLAFNQERIKTEKLDDKIQVELLDYRDLPQTPTFDKIVSVGMIEHVGLKNYPTYFQRVLSALKPGGLFLNHGITAAKSDEFDNSGLSKRFIQRYIFPGSQLVRLSRTLTAMEDAGWEVVDVDGWRIHYAKTLRQWKANLEQHFEQATRLLGERRVRFWLIYLMGCAWGFEQNRMRLYQVLLRRQADVEWNLPLTRSGWLC